MSWSLKLRDGDFDVQSAQLGVVRGRQKLVQDFKCAILESLGNDDLHPTWGSTLEGGIGADGQYLPGVIGQGDRQVAANAIDTEIRRIGAQLQERQIARIKNERLTYNKVTLTASEILIAISRVRITQAGSSMIVTVTLQTGANDLVDLSVPILDESIVGR